MLALAVLIAGGAGLRYGYSLRGDQRAVAVDDTSQATTAAVTAPPTTAGRAEPDFETTVAFTRARPGHVVPPTVTEYLNANTLVSLAVHPDGSLWSAGPGGVVQWDPDDGSYVRHTTADGTGPVGAADIAITPSGDVWVTTDTGLSHWNGAWLDDRRPSFGSVLTQLTAIAATPDGSVWVASADWAQGEFRIHRSDGGFAGEVESFAFTDEVQQLVSAPNGDLWAISQGDPWRLTDEAWVRAMDAGFAWVDDLALDADGTAWLATQRWVRRWENGALVSVPEDGSSLFASDGWVHSVVVDHDGVAWASTVSWDGVGETRELIRLDDMSRFPIPTPHVGPMVVGADGALWMATPDGVIGFAGETWSTLRIDGDPPLRWAETMAVDADGTVWIAGGGEIVSWDGERWSVTGPDDLGLTRRPEDEQGLETWVAARPGGATWAGLGCAASARVDGLWIPVGAPPETEGALFCRASDHVVESDGSLWLLVEAFGGSGPEQAVHHFEDSTWSQVAAGPESEWLVSVTVAADGAVWAAGDGVLRLTDGGWTTILGGLPFSEIEASGDGSIWAAQPCRGCTDESSGLWRLSEGVWNRESEIAMSRLAMSADDTLWMLGRGVAGHVGRPAVWRFEQDRFRPLVVEQEFATLAVGPDGSGWVADRGRLLRIEPRVGQPRRTLSIGS